MPASPTVEAEPRPMDETRTREQIQAFKAHAAVFVAGMVPIFLVNLLTNLSAGVAGNWGAWWSAWALIGWSSGLAIHGLVLRLELSKGVMPEPPRTEAIER